MSDGLHELNFSIRLVFALLRTAFFTKISGVWNGAQGGAPAVLLCLQCEADGSLSGRGWWLRAADRKAGLEEQAPAGETPSRFTSSAYALGFVRASCRASGSAGGRASASTISALI